MNYFELYDIPVNLFVDPETIKKKFYQLSRQYHPDFFTNTSGEEQADVLEKSSMVNKGYKVFQNKDETIKYVLQLKGLVEEEEKYQLPPDFLLEVMEINEGLMEYEMDQEPGQLLTVEKNANVLLKQIYSDVAHIIEHYQEGITTKEELLQVKDYYYRKKYLKRILDKIQQMTNIAPRSS